MLGKCMTNLVIYVSQVIGDMMWVERRCNSNNKNSRRVKKVYDYVFWFDQGQLGIAGICVYIYAEA